MGDNDMLLFTLETLKGLNFSDEWTIVEDHVSERQQEVFLEFLIFSSYKY